MVLTSHSTLGNTGQETGFWLEEFAAPYYVFKDAGADTSLASPLGGQPPLDPKSDVPASQPVRGSVEVAHTVMVPPIMTIHRDESAGELKFSRRIWERRIVLLRKPVLR